ncbi:MBOAT family O-acyltransferase [Leptospira alstonii]|uniref:Membrane-bound O-acyltransferase family MBOAT n=2 Tax=Leptospira alstonii TaxID=28452 RepID=M6DDY5_9LEPT|nr:MBOAT family O-acyltransferase [Leptospira alstonii]EMJ96780.1 membrane-bound O-acyltransferase family MBOAT [Leptospira alstonii serovar Sichuan str. 79601]EQA78663.1 membrane-bound O-acyltransferase family MBOAT [Leptospira alstonii serovar Pingchang str. 80-412]
MNFTTPQYFLFFVIVWCVRWTLTAIYPKKQSFVLYFLLSVSYFFYLSWDYRFGVLILFTTALDYSVGRALGLQKNLPKRRALLFLSLLGNLSVLGFFKYFHFFADSFLALFHSLGWQISAPTLKVILPVGISFYTFQSLSYSIDVYRERIQPEKNFFHYALFLSFFPQLVAGPIVSARILLPALRNMFHWENVPLREGIWLILLGFVKKAVIADRISVISDFAYQFPESVSTLFAWMGVISYSIQIYCDFSGYTDIAIGSALLLGIRLPENFRLPYTATSFSDFWRRWHISLSGWLRDYLYIPLGGNRINGLITYRNLLITMFLGGLWHGASWNFVIWGFIHGIFLALERCFSDSTSFSGKERGLNRGLKFLYQIFVILCICLIWIFFRSKTFSGSIELLSALFSFRDGTQPTYTMRSHFLTILFFMILATWIGKKEESSGVFSRFRENLHWSLFAFLSALGFIVGVVLTVETKPFLYFVF